MIQPKVLVDSNILYGLYRKYDPRHDTVRQIFETVKAEFIAPQVVLTEAAYLFNRAGGMPLVATFLDLLTVSNFTIEPVLYADLRRASALLRQYPGTKIEFVDCCIVAMAERLGVTQVVTLDRRDFSIMRTKDGRFLTLLP